MSILSVDEIRDYSFQGADFNSIELGSLSRMGKHVFEGAKGGFRICSCHNVDLKDAFDNQDVLLSIGGSKVISHIVSGKERMGCKSKEVTEGVDGKEKGSLIKLFNNLFGNKGAGA